MTKKNLNNHDFNKDWRDESNKKKDREFEEYLRNVFPRTYKPPFFSKHHRVLCVNFYERIYQSFHNKTVLKNNLNKVSQGMDLSLLDSLVLDYEYDSPIISKDLENTARRRLHDSINQIRRLGALSYSYKPLALSPQFFSTSYGLYLGTLNRMVIEKSYDLMGEKALEMGQILVGLSLRPCHISIIEGLEGEGTSMHMRLFEELRTQYTNANRESPLKKSLLLTGAFCAILGGKPTGISQAMMQAYRKDLGLPSILNQFTNSDLSLWKECKNWSDKMAEELSQMETIQMFQRYTKVSKAKHQGTYFMPPTGENYPVDETLSSFKKIYPQYLEGFQMALIYQSIFKYKDRYPKAQVELIGHLGDQCILSLDEIELEHVLYRLAEILSKVGSELGLMNVQKFQPYRFFPPPSD